MPASSNIGLRVPLWLCVLVSVAMAVSGAAGGFLGGVLVRPATPSSQPKDDGRQPTPPPAPPPATGSDTKQLPKFEDVKKEWQARSQDDFFHHFGRADRNDFMHDGSLAKCEYRRPVATSAASGKPCGIKVFMDRHFIGEIVEIEIATK